MTQTNLSDVSAVILASGAGTRLGDLTREIPKPLLEFGGKPYLKYLLDWLIVHGISDIVVTVCTHGDKINEFIAREKSYEGKVRVVAEDVLISTAESARCGLRSVSNALSFIMTADTVWDVDLDDMLIQHVSQKAQITSMAFAQPKPDLPHVVPLVKVRYGDNRVLDMCAPRYSGDSKEGKFEYLATAGLYLVDVSKLLQVIRPDDKSIERESMNRLVPYVYVYRNEKLLLDYGIIHNYVRLKNNHQLILKYFSSDPRIHSS
jgi:D-glycero-alpha-D-manno-heptose 1-phosphate guanylyltransferase